MKHSGALSNYSEGIVIVGLGDAVKYNEVCVSPARYLMACYMCDASISFRLFNIVRFL